jgi:hypothetical protein
MSYADGKYAVVEAVLGTGIYDVVSPAGRIVEFGLSETNARRCCQCLNKGQDAWAWLNSETGFVIQDCA